MTVSANVSRVTFAGDDVTTSFDLGSTLVFFDDTDLVIEVVTDATGASEELTLNADYTVSGGDGATGTVDLSGGSSPHGALVSDTTLVVRRVLPITQTDDYVNGAISDAEVIEDRFDRLTMIAQQLDDESARALRAPPSESAVDNLPTRAARRNKFFKFDDTVDAKPTAVAASTLGTGLVLDENDFASDSEDDAPSQQSAAAYIADQIADNTEGKQTIWVPAASMIPAVTSGCAQLATVETTAGRPDMNVLDFDDGSDEYAQFSVAFPKGWDEGTVTFQAFWTTTNTGTEGVAWALQGVATSDNGTIDVAYGTAVVVTDANQGAAEDLLVTDESAAVTIAGTPAEGDLCFFQVFRDVSDAADNMTEDARLLGIKLFFTTNAATDD